MFDFIVENNGLYTVGLENLSNISTLGFAETVSGILKLATDVESVEWGIECGYTDFNIDADLNGIVNWSITIKIVTRKTFINVQGDFKANKFLRVGDAGSKVHSFSPNKIEYIHTFVKDWKEN